MIRDTDNFSGGFFGRTYMKSSLGMFIARYCAPMAPGRDPADLEAVALDIMRLTTGWNDPGEKGAFVREVFAAKLDPALAVAQALFMGEGCKKAGAMLLEMAAERNLGDRVINWPMVRSRILDLIEKEDRNDRLEAYPLMKLLAKAGHYDSLVSLITGRLGLYASDPQAEGKMNHLAVSLVGLEETKIFQELQGLSPDQTRNFTSQDIYRSAVERAQDRITAQLAKRPQISARLSALIAG